MACDLAEYYHIFDQSTIRLELLAALAEGLPPDARSRRSGDYTENQLLLSLIHDDLQILIWKLCGGGEANKPALLTQKILGQEPNKGREVVGFASGEDFVKAYYGGEINAGN